MNVLVEVTSAKRTERITERDLEVLEFVARFGVIPRAVVAEWAETGRAVTAARERRLRESGLIEVLPGFGDSGRLCLCTRRGLQAVGRHELSTPTFSPVTLVHSAVTARVGAQLERAGHRVLSEREIFARERAEGKRVFSAECRSRRYHRPDLVIMPPDSPSASDWGAAWPSSSRTQGGQRGERTSVREQDGSTEDAEMRRATRLIQPIAVEVELTDKSARRLDQLLRAWRRSLAIGQFACVRYLCSPRALGYVERAVQRTKTDAVIDVEKLGESGESPVLTRGRSPFALARREPGGHLSLSPF